MDRRVSLPSFNEIASALPRPAPLSHAMPQIVHRRHSARKSTSPLRSPQPHSIPVTTLHPAIPREVSGSTSHYVLKARPASNSQQYDQIKLLHSHSYPSSHSLPQRFSHTTPTETQTHGTLSSQMSPETKSYRDCHHQNGQSNQKVSYGMQDGVISTHDNQHSRVYCNRMYPASKLANKSAESQITVVSAPSSSIAPSSSFMHSKLSPRYAPYQMSNPSLSPTLASTPASSVSATAIASAAPAHILAQRHLPPKYHQPRGIAANGTVSRANASSSSLSFATVATHRRRTNTGTVTSAPQISSRTPPRMPPNILTTQHHIPTTLHAMREHSEPELIGEREEDYMEENDSLGCYEEAHHGLDKAVGADGTLMSSAKIRTIHKLAERRRRREMKNLFDTLRRCLPIDKTIRLSKWEVLKKAIEVISNQDAEIRMLRLHIDSAKSLPSSSPH